MLCLKAWFQKVYKEIFKEFSKYFKDPFPVFSSTTSNNKISKIKMTAQVYATIYTMLLHTDSLTKPNLSISRIHQMKFNDFQGSRLFSRTFQGLKIKQNIPGLSSTIGKPVKIKSLIFFETRDSSNTAPAMVISMFYVGMPACGDIGYWQKLKGRVISSENKIPKALKLSRR